MTLLLWERDLEFWTGIMITSRYVYVEYSYTPVWAKPDMLHAGMRMLLIQGLRE